MLQLALAQISASVQQVKLLVAAAVLRECCTADAATQVLLEDVAALFAEVTILFADPTGHLLAVNQNLIRYYQAGLCAAMLVSAVIFAAAAFAVGRDMLEHLEPPLLTQSSAVVVITSGTGIRYNCD